MHGLSAEGDLDVPRRTATTIMRSNAARASAEGAARRLRLDRLVW